MDKQYIIGIDSGAQGALSCITTEGELIDTQDIVINKDFPIKHVDSRTAEDFINKYQPLYITVELVTGREGGRGMNNKQSLFVQGGYYHCIGDILKRCGYDFDNILMISAADWKKALGVQGGAKGNKKEKTIALIKEIYPNSAELYTGIRGGIKDGRTDAIAVALAGLKHLQREGKV